MYIDLFAFYSEHSIELAVYNMQIENINVFFVLSTYG